MINEKSKVLIATFSPWQKGIRLPINGNLEPMLDFFTSRIHTTVLVDQVYPGSDFVMPKTEIYKNRKKNIFRSGWWLYALYPFLKLANTGGTHVAFKIRDFFSVLDAAYKSDAIFDYFIGFEAINAIAGVLLRRFGKVKKVIYYVSDYSPNRYSQKWFNDLYLSLDRYATKHSDYTWDVSEAINPARIKAGLDKKNSPPVLIVPNALYPFQIKSLPSRKLLPHSLVFMGTLGIENGPDLAIESLPLVLKKLPDVKLYIVGGEENDLKRLKSLTVKLSLEKNVIFKGFIADRNKISQEIRKYAVALAPYRYIKGSARLYGDATKIRAYMAAGLPTVTTVVPPLGKVVAKKNAALIVEDTKEEISKAVLKILLSKKLFEEMKRNAISFAKNNTWDNEFMRAFKEMEKYE